MATQECAVRKTHRRIQANIIRDTTNLRTGSLYLQSAIAANVSYVLSNCIYSEYIDQAPIIAAAMPQQLHFASRYAHLVQCFSFDSHTSQYIITPHIHISAYRIHIVECSIELIYFPLHLQISVGRSLQNCN